MIGGIYASMDSVYPGAGAARAVDGDMDTEAHSMCGGEYTWLELDLNGKYLVNTVKIMQTKDYDNNYRFRMDNTEVRIFAIPNICKWCTKTVLLRLEIGRGGEDWFFFK